MRRITFALLCALAACGAPPSSIDGGEDDAGGTLSDAGATDSGSGSDAGDVDAGIADASVDAGSPDASTPDGGATTVAVGHQRELRGLWVATVLGLDWPSSTSLSADAGIASLHALVNQAADAGMNALFFQVRPESDALYASTIEPWSRYLTGTQGGAPGYDPLGELMRAAHAKGIEVHAWMNPYRGLVTAGAQSANTHVTRTLSQHAVTYSNSVTMNPGAPEVRQHVLAVVKDLLDRYDIDGLHFDDYFYPYPDMSNTPFPDTALYQAYQSDGGALGRNDWRRENVNALVSGVMDLVTREHPTVRFGISPFGIYRPGTPPGITGLDAYNTLACDPVRWLADGWVDYVAPQLYWPTTQTAQSYTTLSTWWTTVLTGGRHLFPGHATYRLGSSSAWSLSEMRTQLLQTRALRSSGALGALHFRAQHVFNNLQGVRTLLRDELYAQPALPPPLPRTAGVMTPAPPMVNASGSPVVVTHPLPMTARFFALYKEGPVGTWTLLDVRGGAQASYVLASGSYAVSAVGRGSVESLGARFAVP